MNLDQEYHRNFLGFLDSKADREILKDFMGRKRKNLFNEFNTSRHEDYPPLYTMKEEPWKGLPSAYQIYMLSNSEYEAAIKLMGSWTHWKSYWKNKEFMNGPHMKGSGWFGLTSWREEKEIQEQSKAKALLVESAEGGNVTAQKALIDDGKSKRGRPSKAEVQKAIDEQAKLTKDIRDDFKRIQPHLATVNGKQTASN